ncbi:MAG: cation transporting ATPase C-terminal domain-containing protein [Vicinamibacterales bacterium]
MLWFFAGTSALYALVGQYTEAITLLVAILPLSLDGIGNVEHGRSMALATLTAASAFVTAALSRLRTRAAWVMCLGTLVSSFMLIQTPAVDALLHLTPLHWDDWVLAILSGLGAAAIPFIWEFWNLRQLRPAGRP